MSEYTLDASNLLCPMPVIRTQQRVAELQVGDELKVLFTDPGATHDISAWARIHGHSIMNIDDSDSNKSITILIRG